MSFARPDISQILIAARGEIRLAILGARRIMWSLLSISGWAMFAILMGCVIGFSAVVLPLMGMVGIISIFILVLLWVLPDGFPPPDRLIRQIVFVVAVVDLSLPSYYTIQILGLPWISARRVVTFLLVALFCFAYSTSFDTRQRIANVIRDSRPIYICAGGYLFMVVIATFTSLVPIASISAMQEIVFEWYIPFIAVTYVMKDDKDISLLIRLISWCAIVVSLIAVWDYVTLIRHYVVWMPKWLAADLAQNNETFSRISTTLEVRNGAFRASSFYVSSLSFAEFAGMASPFGAMYLIHGRSIFDRIFGAVVLGACFAGIFVSGSRGGYLSLIVASGVLVSLFVVRNGFFNPRSMKTPVFGSVAAAGFAVVILSIFFVGKVRHAVTGNASTTSSNDARILQWHMAWPKIMANPITGYGYAMSGMAVGYTTPGGTLTVDSFLLTLLTETGVPSVIFFFGAAVFGAWYAGRRYLHDQSWGGVLGGGLAASITAFTAYRFFLSQRENMTLFYMMTACAALLHHFFLEARRRTVEATLEGGETREQGERRLMRRPIPITAHARVATDQIRP